MVKGMESLYRMKELLLELETEMKTFDESRSLHREELPYLEKKVVDLQHIPENLAMNGSESARFTKMFSNTLHDRRDLKDFFDTFNTLQSEINRLKVCLYAVVPQFTKYVQEQDRSYVFRTPEMFEFVQSFKNAENRTRVTIQPPHKKGAVVKPEPATSAQERANVVEKETATDVSCNLGELLVESPTSTPQESPVKVNVSNDSINRVYRNGKVWFVDTDEVVVFSSEKIDEIVQYVIDNNIEDFRTGVKAKENLLSGIAKIKRVKKNTSLFYIEKMNELENYLKAS